MPTGSAFIAESCPKEISLILLRLETGIHNMNGAIVVRAASSSFLLHFWTYAPNYQDFDGGIIGATITQAYLNNTGQKSQIDWYTVPSSDFPNGESDLEKAIVDERYWAVIASEPPGILFSKRR